MQEWASAILSWIPVLLLIWFWIYFLRKTAISRHRRLVERNFEHMDRVEALLERIAKAVENNKA